MAPRGRKLAVSEYRKAILAGLAGGLSVLAGAAGDGISTEEWLTALAAVVIAAGAVFGVPNTPPKGVRADPGLSEQG